MTLENLFSDGVRGAALALLGALLSAAVSWVYARRTIPRSHRVAVIGFPQAGKTSLIVALFAFYFRRGIRGASILPRGEETIQRVNTHIAEMESGRGVSPTRDQDLFAFRAEVHRSSPLPFLERRYKLEIGDFPGEQSEEFINSSQPWLHNTNYFEWAMGADAYLFVLDASKAMSEESEYVAIQKSAFRAAWQRIQEHHIDGTRSLRGKTAILVYTKADVLVDLSYPTATRDKDLARLKASLDDRFSDLIQYFKQATPRFRTVLTSVFARDSDERVGVQEVAELILPRQQ